MVISQTVHFGAPTHPRVGFQGGGDRGRSSHGVWAGRAASRQDFRAEQKKGQNRRIFAVQCTAQNVDHRLAYGYCDEVGSGRACKGCRADPGQVISAVNY